MVDPVARPAAAGPNVVLALRPRRGPARTAPERPAHYDNHPLRMDAIPDTGLQVATDVELPPRPPDITETQIEGLIEQARAEGHAAGLEEGIARARDANTALAAKLQAMIESIPGAIEEHARGLESAVADLTLAAVCRLLGDQWIERDGALAAVRQVLSQVTSKRPLRIGLSPADFDFISSHVDIDTLVAIDAVAELEADASVRTGGCIVRTDQGDWDGRLETQLQNLHRAIQDAGHATADAP